MVSTYILQGLGCPACAAKIEADVRALRGVASASCNPLNAVLVVEADAPGAGRIDEIKRIARRHEPDIVVVEKGQGGGGPRGAGGRGQAIRIAAGAVLLAAALALRGDGALAAALSLQGGGAQLFLFYASYAVLGWKVVYKAARNMLRGRFFDENFLMGLATAGALAIGEHAEAVAVMLFYLVGEYFQNLAIRKSKRSIAALMDIRPDYANVMAGCGALERVAPESVKVGDLIVVKPGERIPLDGTIVEGESMVDAKALTGEPAPRRARPSGQALSGCVNLSGALTIKVTKAFGESTASKIIDLVENAAGKKAPAENFITSFSRYYTPAVVGLAALLAVAPPLLVGGGWADWLHRALVFLVVSCPCALVISIPLGFFGGIGGASRNGVLVKGSNYLEALGSLDIVAFDKTGTLTKGVFDVAGIYPSEGFTESGLLERAAKAEALSNHPIAASILRAYGKDVDKGGLPGFEEIAGHGVVAVDADGARLAAGNAKLMEMEGISLSLDDSLVPGIGDSAGPGPGFGPGPGSSRGPGPVPAPSPGSGTIVHVASGGRYAGSIAISDQVRPDSLAAVAGLKELGVRRTAMLTGDGRGAAEAVARGLSIDETHAGLLPGQKVEAVEELSKRKRAKGKLAFVGDGINDAPVLARADVGVAMGGLGSDAAIEAADVVLMTDEPSKLVGAVRIARATKRIVAQNIAFALGAKAVFLALGALGAAGMWEAVFADVGVSLLAVLNSMRAMRAKA